MPTVGDEMQQIDLRKIDTIGIYKNLSIKHWILASNAELVLFLIDKIG